MIGMGNVNGSLVCTDLGKTSSKSDRTISAETLRAIEHFNLGINRKVAVDNYNNDISMFQAARIIHDIEAGVHRLSEQKHPANRYFCGSQGVLMSAF